MAEWLAGVEFVVYAGRVLEGADALASCARWTLVEVNAVRVDSCLEDRVRGSSLLVDLNGFEIMGVGLCFRGMAVVKDTVNALEVLDICNQKLAF